VFLIRSKEVWLAILRNAGTDQDINVSHISEHICATYGYSFSLLGEQTRIFLKRIKNNIATKRVDSIASYLGILIIIRTAAQALLRKMHDFIIDQ